MRAIGWIRGLFWLAALYDAVLGALFLVAPWWVFATVQVTAPNHWGYVQFPAALLIVFALMFVAIARDPARRRGLIPYGIGLKVAYCVVTIAHWAGTGIPDLWKPFVVVDAVMGVLFAWAYFALAEPESRLRGSRR
jgi:hypothetical protein